ncbi:RNA-directed DNA polymerase [Candidatus Sumerlaeota bacterium]|nr:RNA-directed DNA polymerase [Candidatus Sumerlaeota bacterium]
MGLLDSILGLFDGQGHNLEELARRLGVTRQQLSAVKIHYREFDIRKRGGGNRLICAPSKELKAMQRRINQRLLRRLKVHLAATGFEPGGGIVRNAAPHAGKQVVVKLDVKNFFPSTSERRVRRWFRQIGWNRRAAELLTKLCTYHDGLPQGAPTSPAISNRINCGMDALLSKLADEHGATYTRYADDMTFSFRVDDPDRIGSLIVKARKLLSRKYGYRIHPGKLSVLRRHQQQRVTGLVVNEGVRLPRKTRRWLRAVQHHLDTGRPSTLSKWQLYGWRCFQFMVEKQSSRKI